VLQQQCGEEQIGSRFERCALDVIRHYLGM
jgi:hypothetical protein